jgi:hypothetical protein
MRSDIISDSSTSGANATISTVTTPCLILTNSSLSSVDGISAGNDGQFLTVMNSTGNSIQFNDNTGATVANRIRTGTGGAISLDNNASLSLIYSSTLSRWMTVGGVGGKTTVTLTAGESISVNDLIYVSVGASDGGRTAGRAYKLDATNDARIEFIGFAIDAASIGSLVRVQISGGIAGLSTLNTGKQVFASISAAGALQTSPPTSAGQWVVPVGVATSSSTLTINAAGSSTAVKITSESDALVYTSIVSISSNTTLANGNTAILVDASAGTKTITLPAPTAGKIFHIKKIDSSTNTVVISPPSGTIDGAASKSLLTKNDSLTIISDGINFFLI